MVSILHGLNLPTMLKLAPSNCKQIGIHYIILNNLNGGGWVRQRCLVSCHRGVELINACSWVRLAVLAASKDRGEMFFISSVSSLSFISLFLTYPSLSSLLSFLSLFSLSLGDDKK